MTDAQVVITTVPGPATVTTVSGPRGLPGPAGADGAIGPQWPQGPADPALSDIALGSSDSGTIKTVGHPF
ncbi:MAG: hypothetical protein KDE55_23225 [Novosphingobium sp.]|nr:hypothetical protein [Novosphingobium sp.]